MKKTQYQPFWVLERVLFLSHYWYQKEYLDINKDHSIANFLSVGKSTLFVSLLVLKRVLSYNWRQLNTCTDLTLPRSPSTLISITTPSHIMYFILGNMWKRNFHAKYVITNFHIREVCLHMFRMFIKRVTILIVLNATNQFKKDV